MNPASETRIKKSDLGLAFFPWNYACIDERTAGSRKTGIYMMIGAAIAGLLIVSLFLEMVSSSPKNSGERQAGLRRVK
jgi:hypothetical protein